MSRDHRKLRVFHAAHSIVIAIYKGTHHFPRHEWFGLRQQLRRAAVSIPSNIVEGSARTSTREYGHFLNIALGSACELAYLVELSGELGLMGPKTLSTNCQSLVRQMQGLVTSTERLRRSEAEQRCGHRKAGAREIGKSHMDNPATQEDEGE